MGVAVGTGFEDRQSAHDAGIHRPTQAGISGSATEGADSIVVSGGYEDDEDYGDVIVYTGHGGRDPESGQQVADQTLTRQNLALARSADEGLPVRVLRGAGGDPAYSPQSGYRYDGLFFIDRYWSAPGRSGYRVWRYRLVEESAGLPTGADANDADSAGTVDIAPRIDTTVQRIVRNTSIAQGVKELHRHRCQVCGIVITTPSGPYAEAAHVQPLGRPHDGPDVSGNVLCLCPNDHVRFDRGAIVIDDDGTIVEVATGTREGRLVEISGHHVDPEYLGYHRGLFASERIDGMDD